MELSCPACGASLPIAAGRVVEERSIACPRCDRRLVVRLAPPGPPVVELSATENEPDTLFQPRVALAPGVEKGRSTLVVEAPALDPKATAAAPGTLAPPKLRAAIDAYLLRLGAAPGDERIELRRAITVFGGAGADVDLAEPSAGERHFQIEVAGRDVYVRDLGTPRGTLLNGRPVRYTELLPGDELRAGDAVLVFRTAGDGFARR